MLNVNIDLSPAVYVTLCGLVREALDDKSDADMLLRKAALELAAVIGDVNLPEDVMERLNALRDNASTPQSDQKAA